MGSALVQTAAQKLEDPLEYLPCSTISEYRKGETIYDQTHTSTRLYLVIAGTVKISQGDGFHEVVIDLIHADELFGAPVSLVWPYCPAQASALENTKVMTWTTSAVEELLKTRPRLSLALMQIAVGHIRDSSDRIGSFGAEKIEQRLARALIRFSERLGTRQEDGSVSMAALTHELLSQYVGTSREMVTHYMNLFRHDGYLQYSRKGIILYREALREWLRLPRTPAKKEGAN